MIFDLENCLDYDFDKTIEAMNEEYYKYFYIEILKDNEGLFFEETILSNKMYNMILELISYFTKSHHIMLYVVHLVDKFYRHHLDNVINDFKNLRTEERINNSWPDVLKRLRRQMPLRIVSCIFIAIKYKFRKCRIEIIDCLHILNKYKYKCSIDKFKKSELRILTEIKYDLKILSLLDYVMALLTMIKFNMDLKIDFYFPYVYNLVELIYSDELESNDTNSKTNNSTFFDFLNYACSVICTIPVLTNHSKAKEVNRIFR